MTEARYQLRSLQKPTLWTMPDEILPTSSRGAIIERFVRKERLRERMRFFELSSLAAIYAKERSGGDVDAAYREIVDALDETGFLGSRVLYLHPAVRPPYFTERLRSKKVIPKPLPHKNNPIITRQFIEARERNLSWADTRDAYLAKSWVASLYAGRWLQSKGITPPNSIAWALLKRVEKAPLRASLVKLTKPVPKVGPRRAARLALDILYPEGIPIDKTDQELTNTVNRYIQRHHSDLVEGRVKQTVDITTVRRAAERRV
jgi:hypothetical protein